MKPPYKKSARQLPKSRLIIGRKPLLEALDEGKPIEKIFILQTATGEEITAIKKTARTQHIGISLVPQEKLTRFTSANHQGVIAIAGLISYMPLQEVISQVVDQGLSPLMVLLDGITDTRNLGAIARSAHCYGAHALIVPAVNSAAITEEAVKTSAGALEHLPICRVASIEQALEILQLNGIHIVATALQEQQDIAEAPLDGPICIVMGAEDKGVGSEVLKKADHLARIPMAGTFDSLNVSVAAGIMLYETFKQRQRN